MLGGAGDLKKKTQAKFSIFHIKFRTMQLKLFFVLLFHYLKLISSSIFKFLDESPFKGFHYGIHVKGHVKKKINKKKFKFFC